MCYIGFRVPSCRLLKVAMFQHTLKMATVLYVETSEGLQETMRLEPESRSDSFYVTRGANSSLWTNHRPIYVKCTHNSSIICLDVVKCLHQCKMRVFK